MKQRLFILLLGLSVSSLATAAPAQQAKLVVPTKAQFVQVLKQQQNQLINTCNLQNLSRLPKKDAKTKQIVNLFCSCVGKTVTTNPSYVDKQYQIQLRAKNPQEAVNKSKSLVQQAVNYCQQHISR
jgi:hypothetical protein